MEKSMRDQVVGTWSLVSYETQGLEWSGSLPAHSEKAEVFGFPTSSSPVDWSMKASQGL